MKDWSIALAASAFLTTCGVKSAVSKLDVDPNRREINASWINQSIMRLNDTKNVLAVLKQDSQRIVYDSTSSGITSDVLLKVNRIVGI